MMNKYIALIFISISLIVFCTFSTINKNVNTVMGIISPSMFQIDLNNNGIVDDNEIICIPDVQTFDSDSVSPEFAQNATIKEIMGMHYLAEEYAKSILLLKPVKLKFTGKSTADCKYAEIYSDNENYSDKLVSSGFAKIKDNINTDAYNKNLAKANKLDIVILNHKSYKYHKIDCEYGRQSHDYTVVLKSQLPKDAVPCKFCHKNHKNKQHFEKTNIQQVTSGNIKLILPDFTNHLKPDTNCTTIACKTLLSEINKSKETIDLAIYGYTNVPKITQALQNAKARNVRIRIVYDKQFSNRKDYYPDTGIIVKLANASKSDYIQGQSANTNKLMHNKFIIFDNKTILTGSMNLSNTGLSDFNANTILLINSKEIASNFTNEFEQMLSGKFHNSKKKVNENNTFYLNGATITVLFSPYDRASEYIIPIINNARSYIYIPAFLITHSKITDALLKAKKRGVDIKIILDATSTSATHTKYDILRKGNILVKTEIFAGKMHSKSIIIDDTYVIAGSMNFSNSGENKNDENCLIIKDAKLAKEYKKFFLYLWNKIPDYWLTHNAQAEGKNSIGSCNDGIDNDFDGKIDMADSGCLNNSR